MQTPVLLVAFNRPDTTQEVFNRIREARPSSLYVACDAPREGNIKDPVLCSEVRRIVTNVDWPCELKTRFLDNNLGCDVAVPEAITWFFDQEEQGIILEDDCLPELSFFKLCEEMLEYYKTDTRIWHISGNNFQDGKRWGDGSYYISNEIYIWGWATWRRAWKHFDIEMKTMPLFNKEGLSDYVSKDIFVNWYRNYHFNKIYKSVKLTAWDFKWLYAIYCQGGYSITPNVNMVSNIGFGRASTTHTRHKKDKYANMETFKIDEIKHPTFMVPVKKADLYSLKNHHRYSVKGILEKIFIKSVLEKL